MERTAGEERGEWTSRYAHAGYTDGYSKRNVNLILAATVLLQMKHMKTGILSKKLVCMQEQSSFSVSFIVHV